MKRIYTMLICLGVGICLIFAGISVGGLNEVSNFNFLRSWNFRWHYKSADNIQYRSSSSVDRLEINVHKGNIQFSEKDSLQDIEIYASDIYNGFEIYQKGDRIVIDQPHYWLSFGGYDTAQIQINVPKGYNLDKIEVNMSAGSTKINGLKAEKIEANAAAGRLVLNDLECKDFELDASMGTAKVSRLTCENKTSIQVGAGQVSASLTGYESEYTYKVDVGLGSVSIGDNHFSGITDQKMNHGTTQKLIDVDCALGKVNVRTED